MEHPSSDDLAMMLLIRRAEETLLQLFSEGRLNGTVHTGIGQESCAVGVLSALELSRDIVVSNHRCHGHFLAYGGPLTGLFAEIMGRVSGICHGVGGSQHLHFRNFYSNGILGGTIGMATGMAFAEKQKDTGALTCVFMGDGALGEGLVYESFNMAALWKLPILYVIEANGIAQSTHTLRTTAGNIADRPHAFGIPTQELPPSPPKTIANTARALATEARKGVGPQCLILQTYRLGPHSKGDDDRSKEALLQAREQDILTRLLKELLPEQVDALETQVASLITTALLEAEKGEMLSESAMRGLFHGA